MQEIFMTKKICDFNSFCSKMFFMVMLIKTSMWNLN